MLGEDCVIESSADKRIKCLDCTIKCAYYRLLFSFRLELNASIFTTCRVKWGKNNRRFEMKLQSEIPAFSEQKNGAVFEG
jgi:hypothetical protein